MFSSSRCVWVAAWILIGLSAASNLANAQRPPADSSSSTADQENSNQDELAQESQAKQAQPGPSENKAKKKQKPVLPEPLEVYMGRRIAQTMHYTGAEWLIRDEREREERCSLMLANLGLKRGMAVCDMGCGNGFHTIPMAELVGSKGQVVGVDVQPEMLQLLRDRVEEKGIENVIPILGSFHNPRLPPESLDLILLVDVYHEFSYPEQMLAAMRKGLKPNGLIVLVEYRAEDKKVPIKRLHKMTKAQVNLEMEANGFVLAKEFDKLTWQHMMFFAKSKPESKTEDQNNTNKKEAPTSSTDNPSDSPAESGKSDKKN